MCQRETDSPHFKHSLVADSLSSFSIENGDGVLHDIQSDRLPRIQTVGRPLVLQVISLCFFFLKNPTSCECLLLVHKYKKKIVRTKF